MPIYCPLAEALGITATISILDITISKDELSTEPIPPWNKGKTGLQKSPFKGTKNRYSEETLTLIRENTRKAMRSLSEEKKKAMRDRKWENKLWIYNTSGKHKRVKQQDLDEYLSAGWIRGRITNHDKRNGKFIPL
jgi:hypothetical protein